MILLSVGIWTIVNSVTGNTEKQELVDFVIVGRDDDAVGVSNGSKESSSALSSSAISEIELLASWST